jgi:hypothetical protein
VQKALAEVDAVEDVKAPKPVEPPKPKISGKERRLGHGVFWMTLQWNIPRFKRIMIMYQWVSVARLAFQKVLATFLRVSSIIPYHINYIIIYIYLQCVYVYK